MLISGPYRAVGILCITQILGWGALFYPPGLTMPHIAAAHGWSLAQSLFGFSIALGVSGLTAPFACGLVERHGGRVRCVECSRDNIKVTIPEDLAVAEATLEQRLVEEGCGRQPGRDVQ